MSVTRLHLLGLLEKDEKAKIIKSKSGWALAVELGGKKYQTDILDKDEIEDLLSEIEYKGSLKEGDIKIDIKNITKEVINSWLFEV